MDEAEMRRTVQSVNARWGNLRAILAGDFLLARASEIAASLGTEVAGLLARTIGRLCEGQIAELRHAYDPTRPVDAYVESISGKTASLFSAACRIGGIVAERPRPEIEALTAFGHAYGMVFQVADDVLDLTATEEELGKPAGHDLVEGVYTLPVIHTLREGGVAGDELGELLGRPLGQAEVDKALAIVRSNGGVPVALTEGERYRDEAIVALADLPTSPVTHALRSAPDALLASAGAR
jgi:heptaprenyl diphosphate synthase